MNKESYFIGKFKDKLIGDDGVLVENFIYSMDAFFENVHFKREWMSIKEIAKKAMLINISDAIAMNAKPKYALLSVAIPKEFSLLELDELAEGFLDIANDYGVRIIGGDTISNTKLDISITIISKSSNPLRRNTIKNGNLLAYTGTIGSSKRDLAKLQRGFSINKKSKFITPVLRQEFITKSSKHLTGGMDISDGLFTELERLSKLNKIKFDFFSQIKKDMGCSGEEYEMIVAFRPKDKKKILNIAKKTKTALTIFAKAKKGGFKSRCKQHHF
ncbi:MAG: thiamine-monophosphate kinase [Campylobacterota bacterium]|nr:thiamine-monophosphate kinase [Campylobacterota bacterium]